MMKCMGFRGIIAISALALADGGYGQAVSLTCTTNQSNQNTVCGSMASNFAGTGTAAVTAFGYGALEFNTASYNTAAGDFALQDNATGIGNTAVGTVSLRDNVAGSNNTAIGYMAFLGLPNIAYESLSNNTATGSGALQNNGGSSNTAVGYSALQGATYDESTSTGGGLGSNNTGVGAEALYSYSTGSNNTAAGYQALFDNQTASNNTAVGYQALYTNDPEGSGIAIDNTATGFQALYTNSSGAANTASGNMALFGNSSGGYNSADGFQALYLNSSGSYNAAYGSQALFNSNGSSNTAVGYEAGYNVTTGSDNIHIGNKGAAADSKVIKIGTEGTQKKTLIAGIYSNTSISGLTVVIGSNGELGAVSSSERFKTDIETMGSTTERLQQLRPVTFHYKNDPQGELRYGLIAEEVAKVYPELAVRGEHGRIDGVRYDELAPMLLNEVQKERATISAQAQHAAVQDAEISALKAQLAEMHAAVESLMSNNQFVARR